MDSHDVSNWRPDTATLQWAMQNVDIDAIATAIKQDVTARLAAEEVGAGDERFWQFAADAAVEAVFWPLQRAAEQN